MIRSGLIILLLLTTVTRIHAARTERLLLDSFADWAEGEAKGVAIEEPGRLVPSRVFTPSASLDAGVVWSGALTPGGDLVVGTGDKGRVLRVRKNGSVVQLTQFSEPDVYAVAAGPKGEIYAAPSPGGKIFRLNAKGEFEEFFSTGETYVWDLKVGPNGVLFAATGTEGKIYRVTGKGQGEVWFDADEAHIRRLALDADGSLLAGSAGKGLLYRIAQRSQGVVLLDSGKEEITAIALDRTGTIHVAAVSNPGGSGPSDRPRSVRVPVVTNGGLAQVAESGPGRVAAATNTQAPGSGSGSSKAATDLYLLQGDLYPRKIREIKDDILSLVWDGDRVLAGSGTGGRLYHLGSGQDFAIIGQVDAESVVGIFAGEGGVRLLASGAPGVWNGSTAGGSGGIYLSKPADSKLFARWGAFRVRGEGDWRIRTRSGNTSDPDKSWYPWTPLDGDKVASLPARYLQVEIALSRGAIEHAELFYLAQNQPPRIDSVRVLPPDVAYDPIQQPIPPPQPQTVDQLAKSGDGPQGAPVRFQPLMVRGARTVVWQAQDANEDRLEFAIHIRREGERKWELLEAKTDRPVFSWDSSAWPDGSYRLRITAHDGPDNADADTLTVEKTSQVFTIDHTPPVLALRRSTSAFVEVEASDATGLIAAAYVSYNGYDFKPVQPVDGIADSAREVFRLEVQAGKTLFLRVEDSHGNVSGWRLPADAGR
jgi:hypothetical protein